MEKEADGYGFHLHGERGKPGQFVRLVEDDSPAAAAGLLAGDRLVFVNGECVEGESHQQVVARIRATTGPLELIVVDAVTGELLKKHNIKCKREFITEGIPLPGRDSDSDRGDAQSSSTSRGSSPEPRENGDAVSLRSDRSNRSARSERSSVSSSTKDERDGLRPRLCHMQKEANSYGFNLHSEKFSQGQFIRSVEENSPAQRAGLRAQDKIVQVNGVSVIGMQHSEVVAAIRAGGDETRVLVVSAEAENYFKRCHVVPTEEHISGPLPEPVSERASDPEENEKASEPADGGLALGMSVAEAKERARQKRAGKKAPPMDWSKRNELFSNL